MRLSASISPRMVAAVAALLLVVAGAVWADPPGRVVRLGYTAGAVSFLPAGDDGWVEASANRPLWIGDRLWTADGGRAELQMGTATLRVGEETNLSVLNFDDRVAQFELTQGAMHVDVRSLDSDDSLEIDTPNLALSIRRPGEYRIDVGTDGDATTVAVLRGEAEAFGTRAAYTIGAGERIRFRGTDLAQYTVVPLRTGDDFDGWVAQRARYENSSQSARYVAPDMIGYADLDTYGDWRTVSSYGPVWVPASVASDWAPYRYGHWAWIDPWGWTWIDDAPWGFAPFHYGRWVYVDGRYWAWVPGPRNVRPVYAPALVAFVGGDNFRISLSIGAGFGVAWFPLGPGEIYRPAYDTSREYFTRVNVTNTIVNVTNVTNIYNNPARATDIRYVNANTTNGVTAVSTQAFVQAQPVQHAAVRVDRQELQRGSVLATLPVAPMKTSVAGAAPPAQAKPSARVLERQVVAKQTPPPPPPSLERRQEALKQQPGKPLDRAAIEKLAPSTSVARASVKIVEPAAPRPIPSSTPESRSERTPDAGVAPPAQSSGRAERANEPRVSRAAPSGLDSTPRPKAGPPASRGDAQGAQAPSREPAKRPQSNADAARKAPRDARSPAEAAPPALTREPPPRTASRPAETGPIQKKSPPGKGEPKDRSEKEKKEADKNQKD